MYIGHRTDDHFPGKTEKPRGHNAIGNVRRKQPAYIRSNDGNLEGDKRVGERIEVATSPAPGVGQAHIGALAKAIVSGDVGLAILRSSRILHGQQSVSTCGIEHGIQKKEVYGVAVEIARAEIEIL